MAKAQPKGQSVHLRGFTVRRRDGRFVAFCVRPYLVVEGDSFADANTRMQRLIEAYLADAIKDGTIDQMMARRAPLGVMCEYAAAWLSQALNNSGRTFTKECCIPQHA